MRVAICGLCVWCVPVERVAARVDEAVHVQVQIVELLLVWVWPARVQRHFRPIDLLSKAQVRESARVGRRLSVEREKKKKKKKTSSTVKRKTWSFAFSAHLRYSFWLIDGYVSCVLRVLLGFFLYGCLTTACGVSMHGDTSLGNLLDKYRNIAGTPMVAEKYDPKANKEKKKKNEQECSEILIRKLCLRWVSCTKTW